MSITNATMSSMNTMHAMRQPPHLAPAVQNEATHAAGGGDARHGGGVAMIITGAILGSLSAFCSVGLDDGLGAIFGTVGVLAGVGLLAGGIALVASS